MDEQKAAASRPASSALEGYPGIHIFNAPGEGDLRGVVAPVCRGTFDLARELWGLERPRKCHIYVMTSWQRFFFQAAPWYLKMYFLAFFPFYAPRVKRMWPYAGAWTQLLGDRVVIGVKPPHLIASSDRTAGALMYVEQKDLTAKMGQLICHELIHACATPLKLPAWLNEGIAMLSVDRWLGRRTIRDDTKDFLRATPPRCTPPSYREMSRMDTRTLALHTLRGYWLVDFLEKTAPGFLKQAFATREGRAGLEDAMAGLLGLQPEHFWEQVDDYLI